jgi:MYXO-CTERM domain-containing protein
MKGVFKFLGLAVFLAALPRVVILLIVLVATDAPARVYALGVLAVLAAGGIWFLRHQNQRRRPPTARGVTRRATAARPAAGPMASGCRIPPPISVPH